MSVWNRLLSRHALLLLCTILFLVIIVGSFLMLDWLMSSSLVVFMLALVRHMAVHWVHRWHLAKLVVLLVEGHRWVMVSVRNRYTNMLWHLKFTSLTDLIEGLNRNVRHATCWAVTHGFRWHKGVMRCLLVLIWLLLALL